MESFDHLITINEKDGTLVIYRVLANEEKELFTSINMPSISIQNDSGTFEAFAQQLGENILMDSPVARKLLKL